MNFRNYLAGTIFILLLIWGPIYNSASNGLAIRVGYLVIIPFTVSLLLGWIWNKWEINDKTEILLNRILSATISVALISLAIIQATSNSHIENNEYIRTNDGMEAVGDDILLRGPNWRNIIVILIIAGIIFWHGVLKRKSKKNN